MTPDALARACGWLYVTATLLFIAADQLHDRTFGAEPSAFNMSTLRSSSSLARLAVFLDLATAVAFLITAVALYRLFVDVNPLAAGLMVLFVSIGMPVSLLSIASELAVVNVASANSAVNTADPSAIGASAALLIDLQAGARKIHVLTEGLWLLPLAYLVLVSGSFPQFVGALLVVAGVSWLANLGLTILTPQLTRLASWVILGAIGEVVFMLWLIARGLETPPAV